ncbi:hypothetical protein KAZ66_03055 [Candidatus Woesebacteria bacterium]|nr:hypothetical protein [Candidatus Woesebacteria bacterium]
MSRLPEITAQLFSGDPYYGGVGRIKERALEFFEGPESRQLDTVIALMNSPAGKALNMGITAAGISIFANTPEVTEEILQAIYPVAVVTPITKRYNRYTIGQSADLSQIGEVRSLATAQSVTSLRKIFEEQGVSPNILFDVLRGEGLHSIEGMGKDQLIDMFIKSGIASGSVMLTGSLTSSSYPESGSALAAAGALGVIATGIKHWHAVNTLHGRKMEVLPALIQEHATMMPLLPSLYDLQSRRILNKSIGKQELQTLDRAAASIYQLPPYLQQDPVIQGKKSLSHLEPKDRKKFINEMILDENSQLKPLWQILIMGRALEIERNLNVYSQKGELPASHLPLIGPEQIQHLPSLIKEIGYPRLAAIKKIMTNIALIEIEGEGTRLTHHKKQLVEKINTSIRDIATKSNKMAPYTALALAFPMSQDVQCAFTTDPKFNNAMETKRHTDNLYNQEAGNNYNGNGTAAHLIKNYWRQNTLQAYARPFFMEHYKKQLLTNEGRQQAPILDLSINSMEGINGNNPWGKFLTTILTAAHNDPTNREVGDGYVAIINQATDVLAQQALTNPAAAFELQTVVAAQTDALFQGRMWIDNLRQTLRPEDSEGNSTIAILDQALVNIATVRQYAVTTLMNHLLNEPAKVLRLTEIDTDKIKDPNLYVETDFPYSTLYSTIVALTREAPDLSEEMLEPFKTLLLNSGIYTTSAQLSYEIIYIVGFLKSFTKTAAIPMESKREMLDTYEEFLMGVTGHSVSNFIRVERGDYGQDYIRTSANYYKDCLNLLDHQSFLEHFTNPNSLLSVIDNIISNNSVQGIDWRAIHRTTSRQNILEIILATSEDTLREFDFRIIECNDPAEEAKLRKLRQSLQQKIKTINNTKKQNR